MRAGNAEGTGRMLLWTLSAGVVLRLLYFAEHARSAFFGVAILDEAYYDGAARALLAGDPAAVFADGFRPPLYPLLLAGCYRLGGPRFDLAIALFAQHLLGIATVAMVAMLGARLAKSTAAGTAAGLLYALAGPPLFFEGERLIATLFAFLVTACLLAASAVVRQPTRLARWLALGLLTGLATEARANGLLLAAPMVAGALLLAPAGRRWRTLAVGGGTLLAVLLGTGGIRTIYGGRFQLLPSAGGINLYLGNARNADGMVPRQDRPVTYGQTYRDSVAVFAEQRYEAARAGGENLGPATPARISHYWTRCALAELRADPLGRLRLLARKAYLLLANREIPNNKRYRFILAEESPLLRRLPVRWWLLLALAPLGASNALRRGDSGLARWLIASLLLLAAGIVLFFVNGRFRLPLWPATAALAGGGALHLVETLGQRRVWRSIRALGFAALLAAVSLSAGRHLVIPGEGRDFFFRSLAHLEKGHTAAARSDAERAVAAMPDDAAAWTQLGNVREQSADARGALAAYAHAERLRPDEPRVANNLGVALEDLGREGEAYRWYLRAIALEPQFPPPWVNAASLELRAGRIDQAAARLERSSALGFHSPQMRAAEAHLLRARGDQAAADALLEQAPAAARATIEKVLANLRQPLDPSVLAPPHTTPEQP